MLVTPKARLRALLGDAPVMALWGRAPRPIQQGPKMKKFILIALAAIPMACGAAPVIKKNVQLVSLPPLEYPAAAKAEGHQGTVKIRLSVNTEGMVEDAEVIESSRSSILDAAALEQVKAWKLSPALDADDKPVAVKVVAPIQYAKDSGAELIDKTCMDLNTDVKWFRSVYPDKPISDMRIYNLSLGVLAVGAGSVSNILETSKKFRNAFEKTVERCAEKPDEKYWENIKSKMSAWF
jgi:TonB family protein